MPSSLHLINASSNSLLVLDLSSNCNQSTYTPLLVDLSNNLFSSEISHDCIEKLMRNHIYLNLANNNFSGELPKFSTDLRCAVGSLYLRNNSFTGEISSSMLKNCGELSVLDLGENKFTGEIPGWIGDSMLGLGVLILKSNELRGNLPPSLCHLSKLQVLDISINKISGSIPKCVNNFTLLCATKDSGVDRPSLRGTENGFGMNLSGLYDNAHITWKRKDVDYMNTLKQLKMIDLSSNNITRDIPREVTSLVGLVGLNLSSNNLVGSIPGGFGRLDLLNFLDLSENRLSGRIPPTLSRLSSLGILDLSFNDLSGRIPWDAHLQSFNASTYSGNPGLCGPPLVMKPCPEDDDESFLLEKPNDDDTFVTRGFYVSMSLGFVVAFGGVFGTLFLNKWWNVIIHKMFVRIEDWLYVKIMVNKKRLERYFQNRQGGE